MQSMVKWERWAPLSGTLFVGLVVVAMIVIGTPARYDDSGSAIATWLSGNRREILIGMILYGAALALFLWFLGSIAARLRDAGEARLGTVSVAAGVVMIGLAAFTIVTVGGLAYGIEQNADTGTIKTLYDLQLAAAPLFAWPLAVLAAATAIASLRSGIFPQWYGFASAVAMVYFVVSGFTWAREGVFEVDGGISFIAMIVFLGWTLVTSVMLLQQAQARKEAPRAAMASM